MVKFRKVNLSDYTTIRLGGTAEIFAECASVDDIRETLEFASSNNIHVQILAGGSNTVFPDEGLRGIVLKISNKGIFHEGNLLTVNAGEPWDKAVEHAVENGLAGIECLSGIPGSAGATPIQNVGAYGQEVSDTIESVVAMDRGSYRITVFKNADCGFFYRDSMFKSKYKNRYVILQVKFRLKKDGEPCLKYKELIDFIGTNADLKTLNKGSEQLKAVRDAVLSIRRGKSMVSDDTDNNSFSCGSFFTNPVISGEKLPDFELKCTDLGLKPVIFENNGLYKISAAWLIENSGFSKGFTENGVGISEKHTLALVNRGGTTKNLLEFAEKIRETIFNKFDIELQSEPEIIKS